MTEAKELLDALAQDRSWNVIGDSEAVRALLGRAYDERYHIPSTPLHSAQGRGPSTIPYISESGSPGGTRRGDRGVDGSTPWKLFGTMHTIRSRRVRMEVT